MYSLISNVLWLLLSWGTTNAHTHNANDVWPQVQEKMTNKHLVIASGSWPPFTVLTKSADGEEKIEGMYWDHVKFWIDARNFTYTIVREDVYGYCTENNCTGMMGLLDKKEVEFALGISCGIK